jgi:ATP-dependent helicase/nuclease subunit A
MAGLGAGPLDAGGMRLEQGAWPAARDLPAGAQAEMDLVGLPGWTRVAAPAAPPWRELLSPSRLGEGLTGPVPAGEAAEVEAKVRGRMLHLLLEHLPLHPAETWGEVAVLLLSQQEDVASDALIAELVAEARAVLAAPELAGLFGPDSVAEVDVTAALPEAAGRQMYGRIDRLVRRDGGLIAVDFKSNAKVPARPEDVPPAILAQMGAYLSGLRQVFPGQPVEVAILWTRAAKLMVLPHDMVTAALAEATTS